MEKFRHDNYYLYNVQKENNGPNSFLSNTISHPSLDIGLFTRENKRWVDFSNQSSPDFTNPEKGLSRNTADDLSKTLPSEESLLKFPDTHFLHHFIYNCRTQTFLANNDFNISKTASRKADNMESINSSGFADPLSSKVVEPQNSSQIEIILRMHRGSHADSMIDIKLIETTLALQNGLLGCEDECKYLNLSCDQNNMEKIPEERRNVKECMAPSSGGVGSLQIYTTNYEIFESSQGNNESPCFDPSLSNIEKQAENKHSTEIHNNKVSIKLEENLFLNLITDIDVQGGNNCSEECSPEEKETEQFPSIRILLKSNGKIIRELSPSQPSYMMKRNVDSLYHNQKVCENTFKKHSVELNESESTHCEYETSKENILSQESYRPCCMTVDTTIPNRNIFSKEQTESKNSLDGWQDVFDSLCKKCPLLTRACSVPSKIGEEERKYPDSSSKESTEKDKKAIRCYQRRATSLQMKNDLTPADRKIMYEQPRRQIKQIQNLPEDRTSSEIFNNCNTSKENEYSAKTPKFSFCACPSIKEKIASLGSFTVFFIINDMQTGSCRCKRSNSDELLQTAMICVHVEGDRMRYPNLTTSCPVICSCPSTNATRSSCSCPSIRNALVPSICSCSSVKQQSSLYRPQIKFSLTLREAEKNKSCMIITTKQNSISTQCRFCSNRNIEQTSVQVTPSNKSAYIQPSMKFVPPGQPQSVQTPISRRSASIQPSIFMTQPYSPATGKMCSPSCTTTPTRLVSNVYGRTPFFGAHLPLQNIPRELKVGSTTTGKAIRNLNLSCSSLKYGGIGSQLRLDSCSSRSCGRKCTPIQSKCGSIYTDMFRMNNSMNPNINRSNELKRIGTYTKDISTELKKSRYRGISKVTPASAEFKRANNINKMSQLNVAGTDNFIFGSGTKGDLNLFTEDYNDLKQAFERFMSTDCGMGPKCINKD